MRSVLIWVLSCILLSKWMFRVPALINSLSLIPIIIVMIIVMIAGMFKPIGSKQYLFVHTVILAPIIIVSEGASSLIVRFNHARLGGASVYYLMLGIAETQGLSIRR